MSPAATYLKPLSQAFGLPAPLSGEPKKQPCKFSEKSIHLKPPLKGKGDRRQAVEGFLNPSATADTTIPHS